MKTYTNLVNSSSILLPGEGSAPEAPSLKEKNRQALVFSYTLAPNEDNVLEKNHKI